MGGTNVFRLFGELAINGVDDARRELSDLSNEGEQTRDSLALSFQDMGAKAGELGKNLALGLAGAVTSAVVLVESTRELRQDLGKLETTFKTTGHGTEVATNTFKTLYGVLGEDDTAIEAANHLGVMADNEKELGEYTDILTGVYATFGDSLPLEGLAEAMNHTSKLGSVQGNLADALEWSGVNVDTFNEQLATLNTEEEREALIRETLNGLYGEASETYKETNAGVIANNESQAELNLKMSEMAEKIEPLITKGKIFLLEVLDKISPAIQWVIDNINILAPVVLGFLGTLFALNIASKVQAFIPILKVLFATLKANPIGIIITIIGLLVTAFITLWNNCEGFRNFWIGLWEKIQSAFKIAVEGIKNGIENVKNFFSNLKENISTKINDIKTSVTNTFNKIQTAMSKPVEKARDLIKGIVEKIKGFFDFEFKLPKIKTPKFGITPSGWKLGDLLDGVIPKLSIKWNAKGGVFSKPTIFDTRSGLQGVGEAGAEAIAPIDTLMGYTRQAVAESNNGLGEKLDRLINLLTNYLPQLSGQQVVLSTGELVGALVNPLDKAMGELAYKKGRGWS
jgi:hypothetical protein